jgi:hypothetical protein
MSIYPASGLSRRRYCLLLIWLWCCSYARAIAASLLSGRAPDVRRMLRQPPRLAVSARMKAEAEGGGRKARKQQEFAERRDAWLARYGSVTALQATFGTAPPFGDLSPEQTRSLYHTLLPRSLLGLHEMGLMRPEELAPLAYEARIAAKEYARSRCVVTGRVLTAAFDQYRSLRDRRRPAAGSGSLSWDEIWQKYEEQIVQEECAAARNGTRSAAKRSTQDAEGLSMRIYLRILERSCATNQAFDSLFLKESAASMKSENLTSMATQLDQDVRAILLRPKDGVKARRKIEKAQKKQQVEKEKEQQAEDKLKSKLQKERARAEDKQQKATLKEAKEAKQAEEKMQKERKEKKEQKAHQSSC